METKDINKKQELLIFQSEKELYEEWGKEPIVMSLQKAKEILQSFKVLGLKKGQECIIFKDDNYNEFRRAGEQHISYFISNKKKYTSKQGLGSPAIKDNVSEKGVTYPFVKSQDPFIVVHKCSNCNTIYEDKDNLTGGICNKCEERN